MGRLPALSEMPLGLYLSKSNMSPDHGASCRLYLKLIVSCLSTDSPSLGCSKEELR